MLQARRALFVLVSVITVVAGFTPAAFARPGRAAAAPSIAAPATAAPRRCARPHGARRGRVAEFWLLVGRVGRRRLLGR